IFWRKHRGGRNRNEQNQKRQHAAKRHSPERMAAIFVVAATRYARQKRERSGQHEHGAACDQHTGAKSRMQKMRDFSAEIKREQNRAPRRERCARKPAIEQLCHKFKTAMRRQITAIKMKSPTRRLMTNQRRKITP